MRARYLILILLLAATFTATGQDTGSMRKSFKPYFALKLPLLNFVDILNPNLQVGLEYRFSNRNSVQLLGAVSIDPGLINDKKQWYQVFNGYRARAEYRFYMINSRKFSVFFSGEAFYTHYDVGESDSFYHAATSTGYIEHYQLHVSKPGFNIKNGFQYRADNHFLVEFYYGIGYAYELRSQTGRTYPADPVQQPQTVDLHLSFSHSDYAGSALSLPLNVAVGYYFK
jgi:hypothetical protein